MDITCQNKNVIHSSSDLIKLIRPRYSSSGKYLTTDDLLIFLETEQGVCLFFVDHFSELQCFASCLFLC